MTIPSPEHYVEQAEARLSLYPWRNTRLTGPRRAVSVACYGIFHPILLQAADLLAGSAQGSTPRASRIHRNLSHSGLRAICLKTTKKSPSPAIRADAGGMAVGVPGASFHKRRAIASIAAASGARDRFALVPTRERDIFAAPVLRPPRRA